jgi:hypothetical protein
MVYDTGYESVNSNLQISPKKDKILSISLEGMA